VGFGAVGKYLTKAILQNPDCQAKLELAFVGCAVHPDAPLEDPDIPKSAVLGSIADFASTRPDLIVEVAHQSVSR